MTARLTTPTNKKWYLDTETPNLTNYMNKVYLSSSNSSSSYYADEFVATAAA